MVIRPVRWWQDRSLVQVGGRRLGQWRGTRVTGARSSYSQRYTRIELVTCIKAQPGYCPHGRATTVLLFLLKNTRLIPLSLSLLHTHSLSLVYTSPSHTNLTSHARKAARDSHYSPLIRHKGLAPPFTVSSHFICCERTQRAGGFKGGQQEGASSQIVTCSHKIQDASPPGRRRNGSPAQRRERQDSGSGGCGGSCCGSGSGGASTLGGGRRGAWSRGDDDDGGGATCRQ